MDTKIVKHIATLGTFGYLPAPGTIGSMLALPCAYLLSYATFPYNYTLLLGSILFAFYGINKALPSFNHADPSAIIIDECAGMLVTLHGFSYHPLIFCAGFILFRLFDIFKPLGIHYVEKLPGAYGVLLDDIGAGICAHLVLRYFFI